MAVLGTARRVLLRLARPPRLARAGRAGSRRVRAASRAPAADSGQPALPAGTRPPGGVAVRVLGVVAAPGPHRHRPPPPPGLLLAVEFVTEAGTGEHVVRSIAGPFAEVSACYRYGRDQGWRCVRVVAAGCVPPELWPPPRPGPGLLPARSEQPARAALQAL